MLLNCLVVEAEGLEAKDANGFREGREDFDVCRIKSYKRYSTVRKLKISTTKIYHKEFICISDRRDSTAHRLTKM